MVVFRNLVLVSSTAVGRQNPVRSKNPICMKSKDNGGRRPVDPDRSVTPRYTQRNRRHVALRNQRDRVFWAVNSWLVGLPRL
jgi:hypothetical protein